MNHRLPSAAVRRVHPRFTAGRSTDVCFSARLAMLHPEIGKAAPLLRQQAPEHALPGLSSQPSRQDGSALAYGGMSRAGSFQSPRPPRAGRFGPGRRFARVGRRRRASAMAPERRRRVRRHCRPQSRGASERNDRWRCLIGLGGWRPGGLRAGTRRPGQRVLTARCADRRLVIERFALPRRSGRPPRDRGSSRENHAWSSSALPIVPTFARRLFSRCPKSCVPREQGAGPAGPLHHRRSGAGPAGRPEELSRELRRTHPRPHGRPGRGRGGSQEPPRLFPQGSDEGRRLHDGAHRLRLPRGWTTRPVRVDLQPRSGPRRKRRGSSQATGRLRPCRRSCLGA